MEYHRGSQDFSVEFEDPLNNTAPEIDINNLEDDKIISTYIGFKRERVRAEKEISMLSNRIKLLEFEENHVK